MDKIHIFTENGRAYFVEQETNDFYFTFDSGADKEKIYKCSRIGVIFGVSSIGLFRLWDSWYANISGTDANILLFIILIFPCCAIYLIMQKYYKHYLNSLNPFPAMLEYDKKEEILKKSLKGTKFTVIFTVVSFFIAIGFGILFIMISKTMLYVLSAMILMMVSLILPYFKLFKIRLKLLNKMIKGE